MRCLVAFLLLMGILAAQEPKPEAEATISGVVKDTNGAPALEISVSASLSYDPGMLKMLDREAIRVAATGITSATDESGSYSMRVPAPASSDRGWRGRRVRRSWRTSRCSICRR